MKQKQMTAAALLLAALCLTGCYKAESGAFPESSAEESSSAETSAAEESSAAETFRTDAESSLPETTSAGESSAEESRPEESSAAEQSEAAASGEVKLLWSERGLEAVAAGSKDGYGSPLNTGDTYLDWTLKAFSGTPKDFEASFAYDGALETNGILTVLPASDRANPNGLYLRVDNQADFPYFPADSRERGKFIIENADMVYKALKLAEPPVQEEYTVAVTVSVTALNIHCASGGFDRITVSAASLR